jgi:hypothetical protein
MGALPNGIYPVQAESPYPGAVSIADPGAFFDARQMAAWGKAAEVSRGPNLLVDVSHDFPAEGILMGDFLDIVDNGNGFTRRVQVVTLIGTDTLLVSAGDWGDYINARYKVGVRDVHTSQTLHDQINAVGEHSHMNRWGLIWSNAPLSHFESDQDGQLYTID